MIKSTILELKVTIRRKFEINDIISLHYLLQLAGVFFSNFICGILKSFTGIYIDFDKI